MKENKFRENGALQIGDTKIPPNYVLTVTSTFYISYSPEYPKGGSTAFCRISPSLPFNIIHTLKGDFREEILACELDEEKIKKVYQDNPKAHGPTNASPEYIKSMLEEYNDNPDIKKLLDAVK